LFNDNATMRCMKNKVFKRDTLTYLSGLQFMAIVDCQVKLTHFYV
jgi:hypothetical protein